LIPFRTSGFRTNAKKEEKRLEYTYHSFARFVLRRWLFLCLLLEGVALLLMARAQTAGQEAILFYTYARQFLNAALAAFACALPGSLLVEDMQRYLER